MKVLVNILVIIVSLLMFSAATAEKESLDSIDEKIKKSVEAYIEGEYIKVPKQDFELKIKNIISEKINDKMYALLVISLTAISVFTGFITWISSKNQKNTEKQMRADAKDFTREAIRGIHDQVTRELDKFKKEHQLDLKVIQAEMEDKIRLQFEEVRKISDESFNRTKNQILKTEDYVSNIELEKLNDLVDQRNYRYPEDLYKAKELLKHIEDSKINEYRIPLVVDLLCAIYYDQRLDKNIDELMLKYGSNYELKSTTYVNGALAALSAYNNYNSGEQRENAIRYLDKSLKLTPGYGEALVLKIEIYMIDYFRADNEEARNEAKSNAAVVVGNILKSESDAPAYESAVRIRSDLFGPHKKYIVKFLELFSIEFEQMLNRANQYAQQTESGIIFELSDFTALTSNGGA